MFINMQKTVVFLSFFHLLGIAATEIGVVCVDDAVDRDTDYIADYECLAAVQEVERER